MNHSPFLSFGISSDSAFPHYGGCFFPARLHFGEESLFLPRTASVRAEGLSDVAISFLIWDLRCAHAASAPERVEMAAHLIKEFGGSPNRYFRMRNCRHTSSDARERDSALRSWETWRPQEACGSRRFFETQRRNCRRWSSRGSRWACRVRPAWSSILGVEPAIKNRWQNRICQRCRLWWRRGESNSGPRKPPDWHLQAQSLV